MHPLLTRQMEQCALPDGGLDTQRLMELVSAAYQDDARARDRLERSIRLMSDEMAELNAQIALEARQTLVNFMIEAREPLVALDDQGVIVIANAAAADTLGAESAPHLVGRPIDHFLPAFIASTHLAKDMEARRLDGTVFPASVTVSVGKMDSESIRIVGIRDDSERRRRESVLRQARDAAEAANKAKSSFLAMMSHELRTPLNALLGSAELLAKTPLNEKQTDYLNMFNQAGRLIMALVNDVLDYSKIEAGQLEIEAHPTSLTDLAQEIETMWSEPANMKGVGLSVNTDGLDCDGVLGDPTRLRQVIFNLVSNAVKFTAKGGVTVAMRTELTEGLCQLTVEVEDTGVGIPAERQESIFSPFVQADTSITRRYGGTGLGLAIARSLANQMGGDLKLRSRVGFGSTFTFTARLEPTQLGASEDATTSESYEDAPPLKVLAVDDNQLNRQILGAMLDMWPVEVSWATNGVEALEALNKDLFDVVLMDAQMPVMDGLTATQMLRVSESPNKDVPVVALTANARAEDRMACLNAGMTDFVSKPISAQALMGALVRAANADSEDQSAA